MEQCGELIQNNIVNDIIIEENPSCIICLEPENLLHGIMFTDNCECKYHVHYNCFEHWTRQKSICIMCRTPLKIQVEGVLMNIELKERNIIYNNNVTETQPRQRPTIISFVFVVMTVIIVVSLIMTSILD